MITKRFNKRRLWCLSLAIAAALSTSCTLTGHTFGDGGDEGAGGSGGDGGDAGDAGDGGAGGGTTTSSSTGGAVCVLGSSMVGNCVLGP